jgi:hypothetical protein
VVTPAVAAGEALFVYPFRVWVEPDGKTTKK